MSHLRGWALGFAVLGISACGEPIVEERPVAGAPDDFSALAVEPPEMGSFDAGAAASVRFYLDRIAEIDDAGPELNAVLALNPEALREAEAVDAARSEGAAVGRLAGVPILVKDNIDVAGMATTAGSLALAGNITAADAPVIARLRAEGAIVLGKTNLSEWANFRSFDSTSGWSALGGLVKNPHALNRNACGSSSGSGAAVAAGLSPAALGTETDGSITCPSAVNGIVGLKPTVGLVSRSGIVPISPSQDTAGPMTLSVADAALLLTVMAGSDEADAATAEADERKSDYTLALDDTALAGKRIGVARFLAGYHDATDEAFETALEVLRAQGAELVEIESFAHRAAVSDAEWTVLITEFGPSLDAYLASAPEAVTTRTLADIVAFNTRERRELEWFDQSIFEQALEAKGMEDAAYLEAAATAKRLAGREGIDALLAEHDVVALVAPSGGPAWTSDLVTGDRFLGSASGLPAVAGYPHITVPMGEAMGLPVGLSFIGAAWSEAALIGLAFDYEQASRARLVPSFRASVP